ncbi:MAG: hypothetical protein ACR2PS_03950 [Pseudomonadales bacterium]
MNDTLIAIIVDESKWIAPSLTVALICVIVLIFVCRKPGLSNTRLVMAAMNLGFGTAIATMAFGHLLAVFVKQITGTIDDRLVFFYIIGLVLAVPAAVVIHQTRQILRPEDKHDKRTIILNAILGLTVFGLGPVNFPIAAPALLNIAYQLTSAKWYRWVFVGAYAVGFMALLIGSIIFFASGQSFEDFSAQVRQR